MISRQRSFVVEQQFGLTDIEVDIVRALCGGRTVEQAAAVVGLSRHTTADHLKQVFRKMGVFGQVTMAIKAERAGLLEGVQP